MKTFPFIPAIFGSLEGTGRICRVPARLIPGAPRVRLPRGSAKYKASGPRVKRKRRSFRSLKRERRRRLRAARARIIINLPSLSLSFYRERKTGFQIRPGSPMQ